MEVIIELNNVLHVRLKDGTETYIGKSEKEKYENMTAEEAAALKKLRDNQFDWMIRQSKADEFR